MIWGESNTLHFMHTIELIWELLGPPSPHGISAHVDERDCYSF
jgi:hypothetical protein